LLLLVDQIQSLLLATMLDLLGVAPAPARAADAAVDAVLMNLTTMAPKPLSFFVPSLSRN
jgi:hypothetical protein